MENLTKAAQIRALHATLADVSIKLADLYEMYKYHSASDKLVADIETGETLRTRLSDEINLFVHNLK